jgi:hypothetical protein
MIGDFGVIGSTRGSTFTRLRRATENNIKDPTPENAEALRLAVEEYRHYAIAEREAIALSQRIDLEIGKAILAAERDAGVPSLMASPPKKVELPKPVKKTSVAYAIGQGLGSAVVLGALTWAILSLIFWAFT